MADSKGNSQNRLAKESMYSALMILMRKKEFRAISVTELTRKAGVSRMAFYRNYTDLESVIVRHLEEGFVARSEELLLTEGTDARDSIRFCFRFFRDQSDLVRNLIDSGLTSLLMDSCMRFLSTVSQTLACDREVPPRIKRHYIEFVAGGIYKILIEWAKDEMRESDAHMTKVVVCLLGLGAEGPGKGQLKDMNHR